MKSPKEVVDIMMAKDSFSQWLGIEVCEIELGRCVLKCTVKDEMLNGFQILHGGISYSLSDSALAFASNSYGLHCVSIETSISHMRPVHMGDVLTAECIEIHKSRSYAVYTVAIKNQNDKIISTFKGTVSISDRPW